MKIARRQGLTTIACLTLGISLLGGLIFTNPAAAKNDSDRSRSLKNVDKVASNLRENMRKGRSAEGLVNVILQLDGEMSVPLNALLKSNGIKIKKQFTQFNSVAVELPANVVDALAMFPEVSFLSDDSEVRSFGGHAAHTTGADNVRSLGSASTSGTLDGGGIGIAIIDSGIYSAHSAFKDVKTGKSRIIVNKDFTGQGITEDPYGHGTHVAAAAAGNGLVANGKYIGIAPRANLVSLRVLNSQGTGSVSNLLAALDWVMANRATHNIRVVNMSIGLPAVNSYQIDPVCLAVRRLVNAGVVVVAAAGNNGKSSAGVKQYGQVHSPGNEPSVITVGAVDTKGSDNRADDVIATFSSRGPTRSYLTDANGVKHYDNIIKPEIAAPGNKTLFAQSPNNLLVKQNAELDANVSSNPTREMMRLSGTSMASPLVAGAAALLLQANPTLTPNMVKSLLMYTAQQLPNFNMLEQGAGELNIDGAVRLAKLVRTDITAATALGAPLLTGPTPVQQSSITFADTVPTVSNGVSTFSWSKGIIVENTYATGLALITKYQKIYATGVLLGDGVLVGDGVLIGDSTMISNGVLLGDSIRVSNGTTLGAGEHFCSTGVLVGDGVLIGDGVLLGDGVLIGDGVLVGDGELLGDSIMQAYNAMTSGDASASMTADTDNGVDYIGF